MISPKTKPPPLRAKQTPIYIILKKFEMLTTEIKEYNLMVNYAASVLKSKNDRHIEPKDVVHEAFFKLYHNQKSFCFENMKQYIKNEVFNLQNELVASNTIGIVTPKDNIFAGIEMKSCKCCGNLLPVAFFYVSRKYPDGLITYNSNCKECAKAMNKRKLADKLADPTYREQYYKKQSTRGAIRRKVIAGNSLLKNHYSNKQKEAKKTYNQRRSMAA